MGLSGEGVPEAFGLPRLGSLRWEHSILWARCHCIRASPCPWDGPKHPTLERGSFMPPYSKGPRNQKPLTAISKSPGN